MYQTLLVEHHNAVGVITLNRPEQLNTYTVRMGEELVHAFDTLKQESSIRVVVLTGAGRAFCAGVDLKALKGSAPDGQNDDLPTLGQERFVQSFAADLYHYPKPVIAAINGPAVGVGVTMCLPCDVRLAASDATLAMPFAKLGIVPGLGSSYLLPRLVGPGNARLLTLAGLRVSAAEALNMRLVEQVYPAEQLLEMTMTLAESVAANPPEVITRIKMALNEGLSAESIQASIAYEHRCNAQRAR